MNTQQKTQMHKQIAEHGEQLKTVLNLPANVDPVKLCKSLRIIERKLNKAYGDYCNLPNADPERVEENQRKNLIKLLGEGANRVFFNRDPRGYSLKINLTPAEALYRDWGGYGIIAPDLTPN